MAQSGDFGWIFRGIQVDDANRRTYFTCIDPSMPASIRLRREELNAPRAIIFWPDSAKESRRYL